jgi:hypothetical protein
MLRADRGVPTSMRELLQSVAESLTPNQVADPEASKMMPTLTTAVVVAKYSAHKRGQVVTSAQVRLGRALPISPGVHRATGAAV